MAAQSIFLGAKDLDVLKAVQHMPEAGARLCFPGFAWRGAELISRMAHATLACLASNNHRAELVWKCRFSEQPRDLASKELAMLLQAHPRRLRFAGQQQLWLRRAELLRHVAATVQDAEGAALPDGGDHGREPLRQIQADGHARLRPGLQLSLQSLMEQMLVGGCQLEELVAAHALAAGLGADCVGRRLETGQEAVEEAGDFALALSVRVGVAPGERQQGVCQGAHRGVVVEHLQIHLLQGQFGAHL